MRVLLVLPLPLDPEGTAAARVTIGLLRGLRANGVDARVLSLDTRPPERSPGLAGEGVEVLHLPANSPRRERWYRWVQPYGATAAGPFGARVRERAGEFDVVHFVGLAGASLLPQVDVPAVIQLDCFTRRDRDVGRPWTHPGRVAIELLRAERRACARSRWLLASSPEVAADLRRIAPHAEVVAAPLSLDGAAYAPPASLTDPTVGLIGLARWPPTGNAVRRLLLHVWPRVLERMPQARMVIAGRGMHRAAFGSLPHPAGVEWAGEVPSAVDFLRSLSLLLYPLGRGSGGKVKVLEALALGVPVVTTPPGAEGIGATDGMTVSTDDNVLAEACVRLLGDPGFRRAEGRAGRATFLDHHAPEVAAGPVIELYERMSRGHRASSGAGRRAASRLG